MNSLTNTHTYTHIDSHISFNQPNIRWTWLNNFYFQYCAKLFCMDNVKGIVCICLILPMFLLLVEWNRSISIERLDTITWWYIIHQNCGEEEYRQWRNKKSETIELASSQPYQNILVTCRAKHMSNLPLTL